MELEAACPYCGEPLALWIDEGGGSRQHYVEDCAVCCRPIDVFVTPAEGDDEPPYLELRRGDD